MTLRPPAASLLLLLLLLATPLHALVPASPHATRRAPAASNHHRRVRPHKVGMGREAYAPPRLEYCHTAIAAPLAGSLAGSHLFQLLGPHRACALAALALPLLLAYVAPAILFTIGASLLSLARRLHRVGQSAERVLARFHEYGAPEPPPPPPAPPPPPRLEAVRRRREAAVGSRLQQTAHGSRLQQTAYGGLAASARRARGELSAAERRRRLLMGARSTESTAFSQRWERMCK
ncbi:hypothetical protein AB1Y20_012435 [Prymnesium parvum]|uniref:PRA1 family protein n=1 Tax=Prymnesium parvum TaxID=97485 RepID=A0AB34IIW1_PRYPA